MNVSDDVLRDFEEKINNKISSLTLCDISLFKMSGEGLSARIIPFKVFSTELL
jgi:hypothetical protein